METEIEEIQEVIKIGEKAQLTRPITTRDSNHYRNNDLKNLFGMCNNTITKYRVTGLLPYTKLVIYTFTNYKQLTKS